MTLARHPDQRRELAETPSLMGAAFEELLARFPDYEIDERALVWAHNNNVRGYAKVPMRL